MEDKVLKGGGSQTNCSYCQQELLVDFTQSDLITMGKNVKCFKCGGVLWINIETKGQEIKVSSQLPGILLSGKSFVEGKNAKSSEITVEISSKEYPKHIAGNNVKDYLEQWRQEISDDFQWPDACSAGEQKDDEPVQ